MTAFSICSRAPATSVCGQFLIDDANERKELLKETRLTAHRLSGISPDFVDFGERHIHSSDVTVENRLIAPE